MILHSLKNDGGSMQPVEYTDLIPELLYFVNRKCTPGWRIDHGNIDFHDLTYVYSGRSTYLVNGVEYKLQQGDFIYIPSGNVREAYTCSDEPMQCYAANFSLRSLSSEDDGIVLPFDLISHTGVSAEFIKLSGQLDHIWVERAYNHEMRARAVFMLILDKLICRVASGLPMQHEDVRLSKVRQHILHNYMNRIEISHLAELAGLNPVYLGAYFKQATGFTLKQYINRIRINNAESLLSTGGYSVSEAAMRSGFDDIYYFSKVYRSYKGYAPSVLLKGKKTGIQQSDFNTFQNFE